MSLVNSLTALVAGRVNVERSEQRKNERRYREMEEAMRRVTDVSPEPTPSLVESRSSIVSRPASSYSYDSRRREGSVHSVRPELHRSQSEIVKPQPSIMASPSGAPDISASDLTPDQLKRTYSNEDVWDMSKYPLPPLPFMKGFGGYRRAVTADRDWQTERTRKRLNDLPISMIDHLGDLHVAELDDGVLEDLKNNGLRRDSEASFRSGYSSGSDNKQIVYMSGGTRVVRGFAASTESSTASSLKDTVAYLRKDSVLSLTGIGYNTEHHQLRKPKRQPSTQADDNKSSNQLSTINELQTAFKNPAYKIERPCEFREGGDPDSALASDVSDDEDQVWMDISESKGSGPGVSAISKMMKEIRTGDPDLKLIRTRTSSDEARKPRHGSKTILERCRTVRGLNKNQHRQRSSRTKLAIVPKASHRGEEHMDQPEESVRGHDSNESESPEICISQVCQPKETFPIESKHANIRHETIVANQTKTTKDAHCKKNAASAKMFVAGRTSMAELEHNTLAPQRRNRSSTAFRIATNQIPATNIRDDQGVD